MVLKRLHTILFLSLFPFWGMIAALINHKDKYAKIIFWYGCVFLGYIHIFNPIFETGADGGRYAQSLIEYSGLQFTVETIKSMFYTNGGNIDVYQQLLTFIVSRFTTNAHFLFALFAAIMGVFYTGNVWMVLEKFDDVSKRWFVWVLIILFLMLVPVYQINGVRMWTALHVFLYGVFSFYIRNSKKSLLWILVTPLIHFSYFPFVLIISIYIILPKNRHTVYFVVFFLSIFVENLQDSINIKDKLLQFSPPFLHLKIYDYFVDGHKEFEKEYYQSLSMYVRYVPISLKLFVYFYIAYVWANYNRLITSAPQKNILLLFLYLATIIQLLSGFPQIVRFESMTNMIFFAFVLITFSQPGIVVDRAYYFGQSISFLLILPLFYTFRLGSEYYGVSLFIGNFISGFLIEDIYPLITLKDFML